MATVNLSADTLREMLHYDAETGIFTWKVSRGLNGIRPGDIAGYQACGYMVIGLNGRKHQAHRLAWLYANGAWPEHQIDHINGVRTDNRLANLRDVEPEINSQNQRASRGTSGFLGATFHRWSGLWRAEIKVKGKKISLGYHKTPELAHEAYLAAKRKLHPGCTI